MFSTGNAELDAAMWAGDVDRLNELAGCKCCCHEHTYGPGCPAYIWGGCRGQCSMTRQDEQAWLDHYKRFHSMTEDQFYGYDQTEGGEMFSEKDIEDAVKKAIWEPVIAFDTNLREVETFAGTVDEEWRLLVLSFPIEDRGFPPGSRGYDGTITQKATIQHLTRSQAEAAFKTAKARFP